MNRYTDLDLEQIIEIRNLYDNWIHDTPDGFQLSSFEDVLLGYFFNQFKDMRLAMALTLDAIQHLKYEKTK